MKNNSTYPLVHSQTLTFNLRCEAYREAGDIYQVVFIDRGNQGQEEIIARYWSVFGEQLEDVLSRTYAAVKAKMS